jgi:hypothetical protein
MITVEEVVVTHAGVKQVPGCDALRIVVVIFRPRRWYFDVDRTE